MTDNIFGRIDRTLAECDARQLPPLLKLNLGPKPAELRTTEPARRRRFRWPWRRRP